MPRSMGVRQSTDDEITSQRVSVSTSMPRNTGEPAVRAICSATAGTCRHTALLARADTTHRGTRQARTIIGLITDSWSNKYLDSARSRAWNVTCTVDGGGHAHVTLRGGGDRTCTVTTAPGGSSSPCRRPWRPCARSRHRAWSTSPHDRRRPETHRTRAATTATAVSGPPRHEPV